MSKGAGVIRSLSKAVASRTVQVTVVPTPVKFTERRAVLHALQKFAKIEVFRKLEDHDASFVSVASDDSGAEKLVQRSPLEYQLLSGRTNGAVRTFLTTMPSSDPILRPTPAEDDQGHDDSHGRAQRENADRKQFTVHVFPMPEYVHAASIRASPLHSPWPEPRRNTTMSLALKKSLPEGIAAEGMSDWESGGQNADMARSKMVEDLLFGHKAMDPGKRALKDRLMRGERKRNMPAVVDGLLHLEQRRSDGSSQPSEGRAGGTEPARSGT